MAVYNPGKTGSHVPYLGNVSNTLETAARNGQTFCQFFLGNPKSYVRNSITETDLYNIKNSAILERFPMNWCTHAPYMMSLTGYGGKLAWSDDTAATNVLSTKVLPNLLQELEDVYDAGGLGVVVHPGSYGKKPKNFDSDKLGLLGVAETLNRAEIAKGTVLLENAAGEGSKLPRSLEDIRVILDALNPSTTEHVGVCIDTAHLQGVGQYDLSTTTGVDSLFSAIDSLPIPVKLIHHNDSKVVLGGRRDLHAPPGLGMIWGDSPDVLKYFTEICLQRQIPFVVECSPESISWEAIFP